jgi:hypothetical protein
MQGSIRLCVELFRDPLNVAAGRDQEFVIISTPDEIREVLPGVRCMGARVHDCTVPFTVVDKNGRQVALLPLSEADTIHSKSFLTLDEQMAETSVSETDELEKMRAAIPRVCYPVMLYDHPSLIRLTITHMETGDELWSGSFIVQNPFTIKKEKEEGVKAEPMMVKTEAATREYVPEPYVHEGQAEVANITLFHNLHNPPGSPAEGQISLELQRVCHADTGKPLAIYGGECSWAIKKFALAAHSFRFGL